MDSLEKTGNPEDVVRFVSRPVVAEDEISLMDLWLVFVRRKWVIVTGLLLGATAAAAFSLFVPEKYRFYTTIALGQLTINSAGETKIVPLDNPETALAKLNESYIPQVLEQAAAKNEGAKGYRLQVKIPRSSNLVKIEAIGPLQDEHVYLRLINGAAQALIRDHNKFLAPVKTRLSAQLERAKLELGSIRDDRIFAVKVNALKRKIVDTRHKLSALKDQKRIIEGRYKHIDIEDELAGKQRQDNESTFKTALKNRATIIKQSGNPATAVTLLMLGNEIQHYQDRIAALDQRLNISLPEKREILGKQLEDNTRAQQQQADLVSSNETELGKLHIDRTNQEKVQMLTIKEIESRIAEVRPTRILRQAGKSISPVGTGTALKIALGVILGLMLGILGVFVMEFSAKCRRVRE